MQRFDARQTARVVLAMGWADFLLKYRGSVLGYVWSFIVPLVKFLVIYHVFRRFSDDIEHYQLYLFLGIVFWEYFSMTTVSCIGVLRDKSAIIKKVLIPRIVLPLSVGWMHLIILCSYILIYALFAFAIGPGIPWEAVVYLPLALFQSTLLALGIGMFLSAYSLRFNDIKHLWAIFLQVLFWLTPIMYAYRPSSPLFREALTIMMGGFEFSLWSLFDLFIRFQPLSILLYDVRRAFLYTESIGLPSAIHMVSFTLICAVIFLVGTMVFQRRSRYFIQEY